VIALVGVVNTLALSVMERTREIGLLRAVGMQRRQVRRMIRGEAVVVSLIGAVLGLVVGIALGAAVVSALSASFITTLAIPVGTVITVLILAAIFGVIAAVGPARRAAKLDVLTAIYTV
jgi:putative ABC transport system permease protein